MTAANQKNPSTSGATRKRMRRTPRLHPKHKQIKSFGIGMDVHKDSIVTCISGRLPNEEIVVLRDHTFCNNSKGVQELCRFLKPYASKAQILMECTGVYHVALYRSLQEHFPTRQDKIIAMNPLLVHNRIADLGSKTDRADARVLSSLAFYEEILRPSYVGSVEFFALRDVMRTYLKNSRLITVYKNRIHRHLHLANQKFAFDLNAEWSLKFLDRYLSKEWSLEECYQTHLLELQSNRSGQILAKRAAEIIPNAEISLGERERFLLRFDFLRLLQAQQAGAVLLSEAEQHVLRHPGLRKHYEHLSIIPGFSSVTILTVLTEVGNYSRFRNANAFSKFCGVVPTVESSGTFKAKGHVNRFTNKYLRNALTQAAGAVIGRPNRNTDIGAYAYKQYKIRGLPFKKCMMKVAFKYSRIIFGLLTDIRSYDPHHETVQRKKKRLERRLARQQTALENRYTRPLKRDISTFLVSHSEFLNSTSKYHLVTGFKRLIRKANHLDRKEKEEGTQ